MSGEWWTTSDVAAYLDVKVATVGAYRMRDQMPAPDMTVGRTHMWRPARIIEWHGSRPGPGVGRHSDPQAGARAAAGAGGEQWAETGLVFTSSVVGTANVRRAFRRIVRAAGLAAGDWTPRGLRHSFVSILSAEGVTVEQIAELCGHAGTRVTEAVYRHQLRPVLLGGAIAMDQIFKRGDEPPDEA